MTDACTAGAVAVVTSKRAEACEVVDAGAGDAGCGGGDGDGVGLEGGGREGGADPGVEVLHWLARNGRTGAGGGDGGSFDCRQDAGTAEEFDDNRPCKARGDRHGAMEKAGAAVGFTVAVEIGQRLVLAVDGYLDFYIGGVAEEGRVEDAVLDDLFGEILVLKLSSGAPRGAATVAGSVGVGAVPSRDTLLSERGRTGLEQRGDVRQKCAPAIVRHSLDVVERRPTVRGVKGFILLVIQRTDIVRLAKIVPRDDLYVFGRGVNGQNLLPPIIPQVVAAPEPVLAVTGQVGVEPGRDGHHVGFSLQGVEVGSVRVGGHVLIPLRPGLPAEQAIGHSVGETDGPKGADGGPVGHEESVGGGLDLDPVGCVAYAFKGRYQGL